jgi:LacI family transcriptional regulator, galactose operon repressor
MVHRRSTQPRGMSSLRDVARLAGVSVPTASQALNGRARISDATRKRVVDAARRLRYTPHAAARRLILGRSDSVAIVPGSNMTGIFSDLFYRAVLTGVGGVFEDAGYRMLITPPLRSASQPPQFVQMASAREIDGVLVAGAVDGSWVKQAMEAGTPVVLLDNHLPGRQVPAVVNDNAGGAYSATRHLVKLGHTRIGFLGAAVDYPFGRETHDGYRLALADAGLRGDPALEMLIPIDTARARAAANGLLSLADPPSAIFAVTDLLALSVITAARERGLAIPADLSVVGMDDVDLAAVTNPPLTTVRIAKEDMGRRAAQMLVGLIGGTDVSPRVVVLPNELIVRGTTGGRR